MNHVPGKKVFQKGDRPFLECLRKHGVVGVEERVSGNLPCLVPWNVLLVDEDTHKFRDCKRRVRLSSEENDKLKTVAVSYMHTYIIELDGDVWSRNRYAH